MSKRSRSESESSSSSSSSSSSVEAATPSGSTSKISASRSNAGYRPPCGFEPVAFSSSSPLLQNKLTASKSQAIWAVRVPSRISPSQLDGVAINLPRDGDSSKPLGTITVPHKSSGVVDTYQFHASSVLSTKGKGKKAQASSADSQLIAMAADRPMEDKKDAGVAAGEDSSELASLHLLVPAGDGEEDGKLVMAPVKVDKCLRLSIVSPAETQNAQKVKESSNKFEEKKLPLPLQPWHLLKGNFKPAGSRNQTEAAAEEQTSQDADDSKVKKEKKRKVKSEGEKGAEKKSKKSKKE